MRIMLSLLFLIIWKFNINAQSISISPEVISSAGATFQENFIQIDWTLGELAVTTIQGISSQITQGFHQTNSTVTSIDEFPQELGDILVYPNPTSERIEMKFNFDQIRKVKIQMLDINGRVLWTMERKGSQIEELAEINGLSNGNYFLNFIIDENKYSKTIIIQKLD